MKRRLLPMLSMLGVLAGCPSTPLIEAAGQAHDEAGRQVAAARAAPATNADAPIVLPVRDIPYLPRKSLPRGALRDQLPAALRSPKLVHFSTQQGVGVRQFGRLLAEEFNLAVKVEEPSNGAQPAAQNAVPEPRIDLAALPPMPLRELVGAVTRMLGTDWDWQDDALLIQSAFTRSYPVSSSPDTSEGRARIGKQTTSTTGANGGGGNSGASGNFNNELVSGSEHKLDPWKDLEQSLGQIAGVKNVVLGKAFNVVTVTCPKACHRIVKQFIDNVNH